MHISGSARTTVAEGTIREFIVKEHGHFVVAGDDRIFLNVLRRTVVTELGLPSTSLTVLTDMDHLFKHVRELSVRHRSLVLFAQETVENKKIDDVIRQILVKIRNCKIVLIVTEAELNHLALLREQGLADNWIVKPVVINQLLQKVSSIINPNGGTGNLVAAAETLLAKGDFKNVLIICRKIFEQAPESPSAYMLMGDAYRGLDMEAEMLEAYEQAAYLDHMFLDPIKKIVDYYHVKGDKDKEIQYMEKLDAMSPLNMGRKMEIARLHLEAGNPEEAKSGFDEIMKISSKKMLETISDTATQIGFIYARNNNPEAEAYFRKAIEVRGENLTKSNITLFNNLGLALRKVGKWKEAVAEYGKALEIDPENFALHYNMALAYAEGRDYDTACESMLKTLEVNPDICKQDSAVAYNMGTIFYRVGRLEQARDCMEKALAINPEHEKAQRLLQALPKKDSGAEAAAV